MTQSSQDPDGLPQRQQRAPLGPRSLGPRAPGQAPQHGPSGPSNADPDLDTAETYLPDDAPPSASLGATASAHGRVTRPANVVLKFQNGRRQGERVTISAAGATIGRAPGVTILLEDSRVSKLHAEIAIRDGIAQLRDLRSKNGSRVNGERVESAPLRAGDVIELGDSWLVVEEAPGFEATAAPAAVPGRGPANAGSEPRSAPQEREWAPSAPPRGAAQVPAPHAPAAHAGAAPAPVAQYPASQHPSSLYSPSQQFPAQASAPQATASQVSRASSSRPQPDKAQAFLERLSYARLVIIAVLAAGLYTFANALARWSDGWIASSRHLEGSEWVVDKEWLLLAGKFASSVAFTFNALSIVLGFVALVLMVLRFVRGSLRAS